MSKFPGVTFAAFKDSRTHMVYGARVAFEPGVYQGTGEERRVNIVLEVDDATLAAVKGMEAGLAHSCVKDSTVKCKLHKDKVKIYDAVGKPTAAPPEWRGKRVNASLEARGTWSTRSQNGLCLEVSNLQLLPEEPETCPF